MPAADWMTNSPLTRRILAAFLGAAVILASSPGHAQAGEEFSSGPYNEYEYREVFFLTGEPIVLTGKRQVTYGKGKTGVTTTRLTFRLENPERKVRASRSVTLITKEEKSEKKGQSVATTSVQNFSETVTVDKDQYRLTDYRLSRSTLIDHQPAVDYFAGNWTERRIYELNRGEGIATVEAVAETYGYDHKWGKTETQLVDYTFSFDGKSIPSSAKTRPSWSGSARARLSFDQKKDVAYLPAETFDISFEGGYLLTTRGENVLRYTYDLPQFDQDGGLVSGVRRTGQLEQKLESAPTQQRLPVSRLRDVRGHWAQTEIEKLHALGVLETGGTVFGPALPMTRVEFARAIAVSAGLGEADVTVKKSPILPVSRVRPVLEVSPFSDVPTSDRNYRYVKAVNERGIIDGVDRGVFDPQGLLTRAQAITIIVRALGLETRAPNPGYRTPFADDGSIPDWSRDAIFVASQLGLVKGDAYGYVLPNEVMTRAEAAVLVDRFIRFLQSEIRQDYRERLINYR